MGLFLSKFFSIPRNIPNESGTRDFQTSIQPLGKFPMTLQSPFATIPTIPKTLLPETYPLPLDRVAYILVGGSWIPCGLADLACI